MSEQPELTEEQLAQEIFKYRHAKKHTLGSALSDAGMLMTEEQAEKSREWELIQRKLESDIKLYQRLNQINHARQRNMKWYRKLANAILRFIDWLNGKAGAEPYKTKNDLEDANEAMSSLEELFYSEEELNEGIEVEDRQIRQGE